MHRTRVALASLVVLLGLACGGETATPPPPTPEPVAEQPPAPAPVRGKHKAKAGKRGKAGKPDDVVAAYLEDCAATFGVEDPDFGNSDDECTWREFNQNCAPDTTGCYDRSEQCQDGCQPSCQGCQARCAGVCEDCKSGCEGKGPGCERTCAENRATCRQTCLEGKTTCESTCGTAEQDCYQKAQKEKEAKCPHCSELNQCEYRKMGEGKEREECLQEFPDDPPECLDLCYEQ